MFDMFASEVMREALLPAFIIAAVAASLSVMILAYRLAFLTVGASHATLAGVGLALFFALPVLPIASAVAIAMAMLLTPLPRKLGLSEDTGTGLLFAISMATGVVLLSLAPQSQGQMFSVLFGNILTVSAEELTALWLMAAITLWAMLSYARRWWCIAFDPESARASGMPVDQLTLGLHALIGLGVVMCVKLAGVVLTTGLMTLPAACAWFWGRSLASLWLLSLVFAILGVFLGMAASYEWDIPSGAAIVLALACLFLLSWGISCQSQKNQRQRKQAS